MPRVKRVVTPPVVHRVLQPAKLKPVDPYRDVRVVVRLFVRPLPLLVVPFVRPFYVNGVRVRLRIFATRPHAVIDVIFVRLRRLTDIFRLPKAGLPSLFQV